MNSLNGYDVEDLSVGMTASFSKTFIGDRVAVEGEALVMTTARRQRQAQPLAA